MTSTTQRQNATSDPQDQRPHVAIISNSLTPYRQAVHLRVARELREIRLSSVFTHETAAGTTWGFDAPAEIGPVSFGRGQSSKEQTKLRNVLREWRKGGKIIEWMKAQRVQAVMLMGYNDAARLRIIRWCRRDQVPVYVWGDSNIVNDRPSGLKGILKRLILPAILRRCTGVLASGSRGKAYFQRYGVEEERIFLFPLEPDYQEIWGLSEEFVRGVAERFGLRAERRRIVFSGRLVGLKRVDLLVRAFEAIAKQRPEWDLVIVGDGPMRKELEAMVPADLAPRVTWTGFLNDQAVVSAIYRACDVLALTSEKEPWALVVNEAAAAGLAIVSSSIPGAAAELVRDGVNGRIFPSGELQKLTECLLDVTDARRIDAMKAASAEVLKEWSEVADPVKGLRSALVAAGLLGRGPA